MSLWQINGEIKTKTINTLFLISRHRILKMIPAKWKKVNFEGQELWLNTEDSTVHKTIPTITISDEDFHALKARIALLEDELKKAKAMEDWEPLDPVSITSGRIPEMFKTKDVYKYAIPSSIPSTAQKILLNTFFMNGNEGGSLVNIKVWTQKKGKKYLCMVKAYRYPGNAVAYDSQNIWLPFSNEDRWVYVQSDHVQLSNCHGMDLTILGYGEQTYSFNSQLLDYTINIPGSIQY
eukprot:TRINITY_DN2363_c0_g1_i2.p1 TRINITY_DN2363_c0_g1~~TRINITY_DN2363_c0_g1_i2.p1  ORF type:complete len:236 (+),score=3.50 TRINITY_DN2363_c0_g1_i2:365-1072(+)